METKESEKKQRLLAALDTSMVMIHLDARRPGVVVPPSLKSEAHLRLNLSYRFDAQDLAISEWGVRSTLHFSGVPFTIAVPWSALFAITSHGSKELWLYPEDMPPEVLQQGLAAARMQREDNPPVSLREVREVPFDGEEAGPPASQTEPEEPKPRSRGHLRVVK